MINGNKTKKRKSKRSGEYYGEDIIPIKEEGGNARKKKKIFFLNMKRSFPPPEKIHQRRQAHLSNDVKKNIPCMVTYHNVLILDEELVVLSFQKMFYPNNRINMFRG